MFKEMFTGDKNVRRITIIVLIIVSTSMSIKITNLRSDVKTLKEDLIKTNEKLQEVKNEFETFKTLTSNEFESTWKSFSVVRSNFVALGKGFHLEEKDICPDEECPNGFDDFFQIGYKKEKEN